jgi:hypothetical protein
MMGACSAPCALTSCVTPSVSIQVPLPVTFVQGHDRVHLCVKPWYTAEGDLWPLWPSRAHPRLVGVLSADEDPPMETGVVVHTWGSSTRGSVPMINALIDMSLRNRFLMLYITYHPFIEAAHVLLKVSFALSGRTFLLRGHRGFPRAVPPSRASPESHARLRRPAQC